MTYTSDYKYLGEKQYTSNDIFFGTQTKNDLFAIVLLPKDRDGKRGYLMYHSEELEEGWNNAGVFKTVQDVFQFFVTEKGVEMAGE